MFLHLTVTDDMRRKWKKVRINMTDDVTLELLNSTMIFVNAKAHETLLLSFNRYSLLFNIFHSSKFMAELQSLLLFAWIMSLFILQNNYDNMSIIMLYVI